MSFEDDTANQVYTGFLVNMFLRPRAQIRFSGPVLPAEHASLALPGLFAAVSLSGQLLVDGGLVNPVPFGLFEPDCDSSGSFCANVPITPKVTKPEPGG